MILKSELCLNTLGDFLRCILTIKDDVTLLKTNIAKELGLTFESLEKTILPFETLSIIADHSRTLMFAISDGCLPSNVGGGYNLRIVLRRTLALLARFGWNIDLAEVMDMHIEQSE